MFTSWEGEIDGVDAEGEAHLRQDGHHYPCHHNVQHEVPAIPAGKVR
jgi:hypothetical protein